MIAILLPANLPDQLRAYLPTYMPTCLSPTLPLCLSPCLSVCLPVCLSVCVHFCLPVCFSANMSAYLSACMSAYFSSLPVCLSAYSMEHGAEMVMPMPTMVSTPYGGRLTWQLPGGNALVAHLKDKAQIRHRKRWSQVRHFFIFLSLSTFLEFKNDIPLITVIDMDRSNIYDPIFI